MGQLLKAALAQGVEILLETPAKHLLVAGGAVVGVRAERSGEPYFVRARHGVLIATGGYSRNEELKRLWLERPLEHACEITENQGDGHLMGMAIGAQVAGLGDAWWSMQGAGRDTSAAPHTIIVNKQGKRFFNEAVNYYDFPNAFGTKRDTPEGRPRNLPAWLLMDSQGTTKYTCLAGIPAEAAARAEIVEAGPSAVGIGTKVTRAESLAEMAAKLGIDGDQLERTVAQFNEYAREGVDQDFHRGEDGWGVAWGDPNNKPNPSLGTLEKAPFFAREITSGALATRGGLRVNARAEVLSAATGAPIPGLYAAGNCSNCATPLSYPGPGSTVGAAMTFGYIAAIQAAAAMRVAVGADPAGAARARQ